MWEAIESNRSASRVLIGVMGGILVLLGFLIGLVFDPLLGGGIGALLALGLWLALLAIALAGGEQAILMSARARQIGREDHPRLWNVVEEMAIASGTGTLPKVCIVEEDAPNAFAVGTRPDRAAIAVTSGLLARLNRDELQGVVAHEMAHLRNLDARFLTIAAVMLGAITLLSDGFFRVLWYGGGRRRIASKAPAQAQIVLVVVAVLGAVLAPLCARLLYFACSRRREYLADASAARFTRYPEGLASALEKIAVSARSMRGVNRAIAPLYIVNPLHGGLSSLTSTHPPLDSRIRILRSMGGRAGYVDYEAAFRRLQGDRSSCIGERTLSAEGSIAARAATPEPDAPKAAAGRAGEVAALLDRLASFLLISCACGVGIRLPPDSTRGSVACPRCGRTHRVPEAVASPAGAPGPAPDLPPLEYTRTGSGWETFRCSCGKVVQLSPGFLASAVRCRSCRREIRIHSSGRPPRGVEAGAAPRDGAAG